MDTKSNIHAELETQAAAIEEAKSDAGVLASNAAGAAEDAATAAEAAAAFAYKATDSFFTTTEESEEALAAAVAESKKAVAESKKALVAAEKALAAFVEVAEAEDALAELMSTKPKEFKFEGITFTIDEVEMWPKQFFFVDVDTHDPDEPTHNQASIFVSFEIGDEDFTVDFLENDEVNFSKWLPKIVPDTNSFIENLKKVIRLDDLWDRYDKHENCFY